jgi:hypothetical protein
VWPRTAMSASGQSGPFSVVHFACTLPAVQSVSMKRTGLQAPKEDPTLELFGALTTALARTIDVAAPTQLLQLEAEITGLLASVDSGSPAADVFRSVLRQIKERQGFFTPQ